MDNETENNKIYYGLSYNKIKETNIELWRKINLHLPELEISFKERFYLMENNMIHLPKCECGNVVKFVDMQRGYRKFCSRRCMLDSPVVKNKRKLTNIDKWGVDNPSKNKNIREKIEETNKKKFGERYPLMSKDVLEKTKGEFLLKWGVDNPSKVESIRLKAMQTNVERYGNEVASKSDAIKQRTKEKFIENWGVDNPSKIKEVREKAKGTMLNKYGVEFALQNADIFSKVKKTNLENWGVEYPTQNEEIRDKIERTNLIRYGYKLPSQSDEVKDKIRKKNKESYNKSKIDQANIQKYGKSHISKTYEYRNKFNITKNPNYLNYIDEGVSNFMCDNGKYHQFKIKTDNYISRKREDLPLCTICNPIGDSKSISESDLYNFVKSVYGGEIIQSYRDELEIDIYLPKIGIGFEYNGLYWHSEIFKEKNYHKEKYIFFKKRGIRLINIWEDDWRSRKEIIKSQIKNWIGVTELREYARNCEILLIKDNKLVKDFLEKNHIQGYVRPKISIGLIKDGELMSIMCFDSLEGRKTMKDGEWNLSRFCNKLNMSVVGGASKLLKYFIRNWNPHRIISYSENSWSDGSIYEKLGFDLVRDGNPDYKYLERGERRHKSNFTKKKLGLSKDETETEVSKKIGLIRIWDCGKKKFEMRFTEE